MFPSDVKQWRPLLLLDCESWCDRCCCSARTCQSPSYSQLERHTQNPSALPASCQQLSDVYVYCSHAFGESACETGAVLSYRYQSGVVGEAWPQWLWKHTVGTDLKGKIKKSMSNFRCRSVFAFLYPHLSQNLNKSVRISWWPPEGRHHLTNRFYSTLIAFWQLSASANSK